jgi:TPP-dependent 2-oxoacid decarboxylase
VGLLRRGESRTDRHFRERSAASGREDPLAEALERPAAYRECRITPVVFTDGNRGYTVTCTVCGLDNHYPEAAWNLARLNHEAHNCTGSAEPNILTRAVRRELKRRQARIERRLA